MNEWLDRARVPSLSRLAPRDDARARAPRRSNERKSIARVRPDRAVDRRARRARRDPTRSINPRWTIRATRRDATHKANRRGGRSESARSVDGARVESRLDRCVDRSVTTDRPRARVARVGRSRASLARRRLPSSASRRRTRARAGSGTSTTTTGKKTRAGWSTLYVRISCVSRCIILKVCTMSPNVCTRMYADRRPTASGRSGRGSIDRSIDRRGGTHEKGPTRATTRGWFFCVSLLTTRFG